MASPSLPILKTIEKDFSALFLILFSIFLLKPGDHVVSSVCMVLLFLGFDGYLWIFLRHFTYPLLMLGIYKQGSFTYSLL